MDNKLSTKIIKRIFRIKNVDEINVKKVENVYNFSTKLLITFALIQIFFENFKNNYNIINYIL